MRWPSVLSGLGIAISCWLAMQIVHEAGHITGASLTNGRVVRVVLHPLAVSRIDVVPNPHPGIVAWSGPITGCMLPVLCWLLIRTVSRRPRIRDASAHGNTVLSRLNSLAGCFAGFCLIANGAYLAFGTPDRVGDCGDLLRNGTPAWVLYVVGVTAIVTGLFCWHRLGSVGRFCTSPTRTTTEAIVILTGTLLLVSLELWWTA